MYRVMIDGVDSEMQASSLAEVANRIRGKGLRFKVWSPAGVQLIDTLFGDTYGLVALPAPETPEMQNTLE